MVSAALSALAQPSDAASAAAPSKSSVAPVTPTINALRSSAKAADASSSVVKISTRVVRSAADSAMTVPHALATSTATALPQASSAPSA